MITERIRQKGKWIDTAYYVLYGVLFLSALIGTTEFMAWPYVSKIRNLIYMGATAGMLVFWMLGLAQQKDMKINIVKIIILVVGMLQFLFGGGSSLVLILTILIGATDQKSAKRILRESLAIGMTILLITVFAAMNGFIANHISEDGRHSFGFIYYSHFADKLLYFYMMYRCLRRKRESLVGYALILLVVYLNYKYTHARTVTICFLAFLLLCAVYDIWRSRHESDDKDVMKDKLLGPIAIMISGAYIWAMVLTFGGVFVYRLLESMNVFTVPSFLQTFKFRLFFNSRALDEYGITLFGQRVYEVTNTSAGENIISSWFYLDNTFMRLFVITGIVTLFFFIAYMTAFMWKAFQEKRLYLFAALLVAALGGLSETYTMNFYYNVFLILAFSHLGDIGK